MWYDKDHASPNSRLDNQDQLEKKVIICSTKIQILMYYKLKNIMPQLVPFYFVNQVIFNFLLLALIIYLFSKFILPRFVRLYTSRVLLKKL